MQIDLTISSQEARVKYTFSKLNGAGNDFIMIEDLADEISFTPEQVARICDRHFGIGGDGIIVVKPSPREECAAYMDYYNSDGTKAQMCGNGVRCFSKFLVDRGIVDPEASSFVADTLSGPKPITFALDDANKMTLATVDMGEPILRAAEIPTRLHEHDTAYGPAVVEQEVNVGDRSYTVTCVSMGNPHAIVFVDDPYACDVEGIGRAIENSKAFPEKTNVEFAHVGSHDIDMRVWERGCGETLACGTGCCATAVAAHITGRAGTKVPIHVLGGTLEIEWREDNHVFMTGPAAEFFSGEFEI